MFLAATLQWSIRSVGCTIVLDMCANLEESSCKCRRVVQGGGCECCSRRGADFEGSVIYACGGDIRVRECAWSRLLLRTTFWCKVASHQMHFGLRAQGAVMVDGVRPFVCGQVPKLSWEDGDDIESLQFSLRTSLWAVWLFALGSP